jgi:hypothetical protein
MKCKFFIDSLVKRSFIVYYSYFCHRKLLILLMSTYTQKDPQREADGRLGQADKKPFNRNAVVENPVRKEKPTVFRDVVTLSRNLSLRQFVPSEETHKGAIERTLLRTNYSKTQFLYEFGMEAERLLDSKRYDVDCRNRDLDPKVVAQHVVFAGDKYIRAVITKGLVAALGSSIASMTKPIFDVPEIEGVLRKPLGLMMGDNSNARVTVEETA